MVVGGGGAVVGGVGGAGAFVTQDLPGIVQDLKPITDLIGQGYSMYTSYQLQKDAAKAALKYGGQVTVPYPVGTVGGPSPKGGFQTIFDIKSGMDEGPPPGVSDIDIKKIVPIVAIAGIAYLLLV
ncbi:hypothetical protein LCGC14_0898760 [marine sediment metagenome]|uniref:Uncharacterized protein n=1 Tax=marine sediment metagenome TaxID=412755 RepID=A0A0F9PHS5_9ZZZZ